MSGNDSTDLQNQAAKAEAASTDAVELTDAEAAAVVGGATAIEYGLIAAGISVAIVSVVQSLGGNLQTVQKNIQSALKAPGSSS